MGCGEQYLHLPDLRSVGTGAAALVESAGHGSIRRDPTVVEATALTDARETRG